MDTTDQVIRAANIQDPVSRFATIYLGECPPFSPGSGEPPYPGPFSAKKTARDMPAPGIIGDRAVTPRVGIS